MLFTIARRNVLRHIYKTLIIGFVLFLGSLIMTTGNAVISGMDKGLEKNIVDAFSGDIILISDKQKSNDVFVSMGMPEVEPINNYSRIEQVLQKQDFIDRFLPVGKNQVLIMNESGGLPNFTDFAYVIGVDFVEYRKVFPDAFSLVEGRMPSHGEKMLLISSGRRKEVFNYSGVWWTTATDSFYMNNFTNETGKTVKPGQFKKNIVCMGLGNNNSTTDIRCDITSIIRFRALNHLLAFGNFMLMDIESYRYCLGYNTEPEKHNSISVENRSLLTMQGNDLNNLFGNESVHLNSNTPVTSAAFVQNNNTAQINSEGTYNLILTFLKNKHSLNKAVRRLNDTLSAAGLNVRAISWKEAMAVISQSSSIMKIVLFAFVLIFFVVAAIMITNTLSITVLERISEIGMMRAIGMQKMWIGKIFLFETAILTTLFGGLGLISGVVLVNILLFLRIPATNDMMQILFGGEIFSPLLQIQDILLVLIQLLLVTSLSVLYPLSLAIKIKPVDAVVRE